MHRDKLLSYNPPQSNDLSVKSNHEVILILDFIDQNISGFCPYYLDIKDSDRENRISDSLVQHFQCCIQEDLSEGYFPFRFSKNPTQPDSTKETDIGVFVLTRNPNLITIIEFEAKRFSKTSNNKEYVCGERGGIERFKKGEHASHLSICGMFGYVQSRTSEEWIEKVNTWIVKLSKKNTDPDVDWTSPDEKLSKVKSFLNVEKLISVNSRKKSKDSISIYHYFINLSSINLLG